MVNINLDLPREAIREAEDILESVGLSMDVALTIFIKRVIKERGFPIDLKTPIQSKIENLAENKEQKTIKKNQAISMQMIEEVWNAFLRYLSGNNEIKDLCVDVAITSGMSKGSVFIYLHFLIC